MTKPPPRWMARWSSLPRGSLLAIQGLVLSGLALLFVLLLQGEWQQLEQTAIEHRRLTQRIELLSEQVARMPTLEAVHQNLQQIIQRPTPQGDLMAVLQRVGAELQRWHQQEGSSQRMLRLHLNYDRLLILLENLPAQLRLAEMSVEAQAGRLTTHFTFQDAALADYRQLNVVTAVGVEGNLTVRLDNVPWQQALAVILRMGKLSMTQEGNVMMVHPEPNEQEKQRQHHRILSSRALSIYLDLFPF